MTRAAVIGSPIAHSRSPAIFAFLAERLGKRELSYSAIEVRPGELPEFLTGLRREADFVGVNVTLPHKEAMLRLLDEVAPEARTAGAVNVVQHSGNVLRGFNTDVPGVVRTLEEQGCKVAGADAWIWGAGGAARATAYALGTMGARSVYLRNRDEARAQRIADDLGALFAATAFLVARAGAEPPPLHLAINSTPLGMKGASAPGSYFDELRSLPFKRDALAFDLVYNPERTPFLALAEEQGLRTVGGLDMLIHQALASWEIWFGPLADARERGDAKEALARHLRERPVFLTGFMGVGKSVVGQALAARLGWEFVDTDEWVTRKAGMPIARIFESQGEPAFRELEREAVAQAASRRRAVVSLGGGALLDNANFDRIDAAGTLVFLEASPQYLEQRLAANASARPLLAGLTESERGARIRSMLDERRPVYERALYRVSTDGKRPGELADALARMLRLPDAAPARAREGA
jgi:shikimate dehydrogenase